jgi:hypothetical protein
MVSPREPHHFEGEGFCAKVSHIPECDGQIDLPEVKCLDSRYDPMEWRHRWPQRRPQDAHVIKCRRIEQVNPAPPSIRTLWILLVLNRGLPLVGRI